MMFEEIMHLSGTGDPVAILMAASVVREDFPWLYELAMEVYKAVKSGNIERVERETDALDGYRKSWRGDLGLRNLESATGSFR